ncbi:hypothetical protein [Wenzhouxiangella sp. EGI_FJ10409]|uniref:hypothetical protein n=1 Tax=Wenzhouxiangella sp. EGI_FJ10409 TaxID=3243767 RepID=UPI0035DBBF6F
MAPCANRWLRLSTRDQRTASGGARAPRGGRLARCAGLWQYRPHRQPSGVSRATNHGQVNDNGNFSPATIPMGTSRDELFSDRFGTAI